MEFERKFLVPGFKLEDHQLLATKEIIQCYLNEYPELRIRKVSHNDGDPKCYFTYKGKGTLAREEHEFEIPQDEFDSLFSHQHSGIISKTRYIIKRDSDENRIEVDVYHGSLTGLITAEVEFDSAQEAVDYNPPEWFGEDVTENAQYKNRNLAKISSEKFSKTAEQI